MEFKKYSSIENSYRKKYVGYVIDHGMSGGDWVVEEKIHGCLESKTLIMLADGTSKTIASIVKEKYNGKVMGINEKGQLIPTKIKNWFMNGMESDWLKIFFRPRVRGGNQRKIICTKNHMFFDPTILKYKPISKFSSGDKIQFITNYLHLGFAKKQVLIGKMLGDGHLGKSAIQFGHKKEHEEYIDYTLACLGRFAGNKTKDYISGYGTEMKRARSKSSFLIDELFQKWNKKERYVPELHLTPISLAFWYMDDGSLQHNDDQEDRATFATCNFSKESCRNIITSLRKMGIDAKRRTHDYNRIYLTADDSDTLFTLIAPYVPKCMQYKLPKIYRTNIDPIVLINASEYKPDMQIEKIENITNINTKHEKYDIETETHNYIANGVHVHNSNLSIYYDGSEFNCAKRTAFLERLDKSFFRHEKVLEDNKQAIELLFELVRLRINGSEIYKDIGKVEYITIYGEIFGGAYPHPDVEKVNDAKKVQGGVYYHPDNKFYAFDLKVNGHFVFTVEKAKSLFEKAGLFHAKTLFKGRYQEALEYPNTFPTTIPAQFGLPEIEDNIAEGVVIKPDEHRRMGDGRIILKNKNPKFSEQGKPKDKNKIKKPEFKFSEKGEQLYDELLSLINDNRVRSVISKIGEVTDKDFGKIMGMTVKDAIEEFMKDFGEEFNQLEQSERKTITKRVSKNTASIIRPNFLNIIDGIF